MPTKRKKMVRRDRRPLTAEELKRVTAERAAADAEKDAILARGREVLRVHQTARE
jgi:hypothetical protein